MKTYLILCFLPALSSGLTNPFEGIDSIKVFTASQTSEIQSALDPMLPIPLGLDGKYGNRLAVLLEPGDYGNLDLHVGYFTSVAGLGARPSDVRTGKVKIDINGSNRGDTTTIFWRSVENLETAMQAQCSQGVAFRRILSDSFMADQGGYPKGGGSGGFIADTLVRASRGKQNFKAGGQQYFVRNTQATHLPSATMSLLYLGCKGTQAAESKTVTYIDQTPVVAEKPYITKHSNGTWALVKPRLRFNATGPTFDENGEPIGEQGDIIDFSNIFIAKQGTTAAEINQQIAKGKHIILSPYVYNLDDSINLSVSGTVLLGLGLATLECADQKPCLVMGAVDDVRVAGLTIIGGVGTTNDAWVQIGNPSTFYKGDASKPSVMSDNHFIVGYYRNVSVRAAMQVNNGQVILDHSWAWRSDIDGAQGESRVGLEMRGEHITAYGMFSEHHWQYSLAWYGNYGRNYFFQCETPWDGAKGALQDWRKPHSATNEWRHWPAPNWYTIKPRCYYVDKSVKNFLGVAVGAYSMEGGGCSWWCGCQPKQVLDTHIEIPNAPGVSLFKAICWKNCGGGVHHCVNNGSVSNLWGQSHTNWCGGAERTGLVSFDQCGGSSSSSSSSSLPRVTIV